MGLCVCASTVPSSHQSFHFSRLRQLPTIQMTTLILGGGGGEPNHKLSTQFVAIYSPWNVCDNLRHQLCGSPV